MGDPLSTVTAVLGLVPVSFQAAKALRDTIRSFKNHPKQLRALLDELEELVLVLRELESIICTSGGANLNLLEAPLRRCDAACREFAKALPECKGPDSGDIRSTFTGWLKIRWRGSDINEFKDTLAGYKSTIAIAIAGVNLRTSKVNLDVIQQYQRIIEDTKADLSEHLSNIDDKLRDGPRGHLYPDDIIDESDMEAERDCTMRCLEVCAQVAGFIEERRQGVDAYLAASGDETSSLGAERGPSLRATDETLRGCSLQIKSQHAQLSERLRNINARLGSTAEDQTRSAEREQMMQEADSIRQCLYLCEQQANAAETVRANIVEDVECAEDSNAVIVSTVGDLITAHRIAAGARSNMTIGQVSDETVQHLSSVHATRVADLYKSSVEPRTTRDLHLSTGRVLGTSNVRTL